VLLNERFHYKRFITFFREVEIIIDFLNGHRHDLRNGKIPDLTVLTLIQGQDTNQDF